MRILLNISLAGAIFLSAPNSLSFCHGFTRLSSGIGTGTSFRSSIPFRLNSSIIRSKISSSVLYAHGSSSSGTQSPPDTGFIATELRGAAMRLHTREQAPKEGEREVSVQAEPYVPTHMDYLKFLVDSRHVYAALEEIVDQYDELTLYRNTGLERVKGLDIDIEWMASEFNLEIPEVGAAGLTYAKDLKEIASRSIPAFMCKYT